MGAILNYSASGATAGKLTSVFCDLNTCSYTFNGKELDEESGMYYYSARYYAPPTFISRDPAFEEYPTLSPYTYCANNPVKLVDPDGKRIFAHDKESKKYIKGYLKEQFGSNRIFRFTTDRELKINKGAFNRAYSKASNEQKMLLEGMKEVIKRSEVGKVQVQETGPSMTFLGTPPVVGTDADGNPITGDPPYSIMPMSGRLGGTASGEVPNLGYTPIGVNYIDSENTPYTTNDGMSSKGSASSMFMHEVLDEFLNFNLKGNVSSSSPKIDKVKFQNAALKNLELPQRNGQDHE